LQDQDPWSQPAATPMPATPVVGVVAGVAVVVAVAVVVVVVWYSPANFQLGSCKLIWAHIELPAKLPCGAASTASPRAMVAPPTKLYNTRLHHPQGISQWI
ncbi:hypothetical protein N9L68_09110, partial [bacterium]|nr:hypothetical protein [bacterium]